MERLQAATGRNWAPGPQPERAPNLSVIVPPGRERYLSEVSDTVRRYRADVERQAEIAGEADGLYRTLGLLGGAPEDIATLAQTDDTAHAEIVRLYNERINALSGETKSLLQSMAGLRESYQAETYRYAVRGREIEVHNYTETLSGMLYPRWPCRQRMIGETSFAGACWRIRQVHFPSRPGSSHTSVPGKIPPGCLPGRTSRTYQSKISLCIPRPNGCAFEHSLRLRDLVRAGSGSTTRYLREGR